MHSIKYTLVLVSFIKQIIIIYVKLWWATKNAVMGWIWTTGLGFAKCDLDQCTSTNELLIAHLRALLFFSLPVVCVYFHLS